MLPCLFWKCVCYNCRVDLVSEASSLLLVLWVRHTAGQQVDLVVHQTTAWEVRDPMLVVQAIARRLCKAFTWCLASVVQKMDTSSFLGLVFRSVMWIFWALKCCLFLFVFFQSRVQGSTAAPTIVYVCGGFHWTWLWPQTSFAEEEAVCKKIRQG